MLFLKYNFKKRKKACPRPFNGVQTSNKIDESDLSLSSISFQGGIFSTWRFATLKIISSQMFYNFFICEISSKNSIFNKFATERDITPTKNICHWFRNVDVFFFRRNKLKLFTQLLNNDVNYDPTYANGSGIATLPWNYPSYKAYQGWLTLGNF